MATIHFFDGRRGGSGKSTTTRTVAQYCNDRGIPYTLVDADPKGDVFLTCGGKQICFSEADAKLYDADQLFNLAMAQTVLVNLPSNVSDALVGWLERNKIVQMGSNYGVKVVDWFVCSGRKDSVDEMVNSLNYWQRRLTHVYVRNHYFWTTDWQELESSEALQSALAKWNPLTVDLPSLSHRESEFIEKNRVPFSEVNQHQEALGVLGSMRIQGFLEDSFQSLDQVWKRLGEADEKPKATASRAGRQKKEKEPEKEPAESTPITPGGTL